MDSRLKLVLKTLGVRQQTDWGWLDASSATDLVEVGDRLVPNRITVDFPGADGQPSLRMDLEIAKGIPQCRSLHLDSAKGGTAVKPTDLEAIDLQKWTALAFAAFALKVTGRSEDGRAAAGKDYGAEDVNAAAAEFRRAQRSKHPITPELMKAAADLYIEHFDDHPIDAIAAAYNVSQRTASAWITLARRQYGFLPETVRGKKAR